MFGLKSRKLEFSRECSLVDLYKKIKDVEFEAGKPLRIEQTHLGYAIVFPPIDENNQVAIKSYDLSDTGEGYMFTVVKQQVGGLNIDPGDDDVLGGGGLSGVFGKNKRQCVKLLDSVADQLESMNLSQLSQKTPSDKVGRGMNGAISINIIFTILLF